MFPHYNNLIITVLPLIVQLCDEIYFGFHIYSFFKMIGFAFIFLRRTCIIGHRFVCPSAVCVVIINSTISFILIQALVANQLFFRFGLSLSNKTDYPELHTHTTSLTFAYSHNCMLSQLHALALACS